MDLRRRPARERGARGGRAVPVRAEPVDLVRADGRKRRSARRTRPSGTSTHTSGKPHASYRPSFSAPHVRRVVDLEHDVGQVVRADLDGGAARLGLGGAQVDDLVGLQDALPLAAGVAHQQVRGPQGRDGRPPPPRRSAPPGGPAAGRDPRGRRWSARAPSTPSRCRRPSTRCGPSKSAMASRVMRTARQPGNSGSGPAALRSGAATDEADGEGSMSHATPVGWHGVNAEFRVPDATMATETRPAPETGDGSASRAQRPDAPGRAAVRELVERGIESPEDRYPRRRGAGPVPHGRGPRPLLDPPRQVVAARGGALVLRQGRALQRVPAAARVLEDPCVVDGRAGSGRSRDRSRPRTATPRRSPLRSQVFRDTSAPLSASPATSWIASWNQAVVADPALDDHGCAARGVPG